MDPAVPRSRSTDIRPQHGHDISAREAEAMKSAMATMAQLLDESGTEEDPQDNPPDKETVTEPVTANADSKVVQGMVEDASTDKTPDKLVSDPPEAPIQRTFTTPDGQLLTVVDHPVDTSEAAADTNEVPAVDNSTKIIEQPVETVKEVVVLDKPPTEDQASPATEKSTKAVNETILVKTPADDVVQITEQPTEKFEEDTVPNDSVPESEKILIDAPSKEESKSVEPPLEISTDADKVDTPVHELEDASPDKGDTKAITETSVTEEGPVEIEPNAATEPPVETERQTIRIEEPLPKRSIAEETAGSDISNVDVVDFAKARQPTVVESSETDVQEIPRAPTIDNVSVTRTGITEPPPTPAIDSRKITFETIRTVEPSIAESSSNAAVEAVTISIQPKAASVFEYPTTTEPAVAPKRWSSAVNIRARPPTLPAVDPPIGVLEEYITQTETLLRLNHHVVPTTEGETHRVTDQLGQPLFHALVSSGETRAPRTLINSRTRDPIFLIRPLKSTFSRLLGPQWSIHTLPLDPKAPPKANLKRRERWLTEYFGKPVLSGSFLPYDSDSGPKLFTAKNDPLSIQGGIIRLGTAASQGAVAAVADMAMTVSRGQSMTMGTTTTEMTVVDAKVYRVQVAKGFDLALVSAILVAMDERRWWWWERKAKAEEKVGMGIKVKVI